LGGSALCIAEKEEKVVLIVEGFSGPEIELDLPVPYNRDTTSLTWDDWDNLSLEDSRILKDQVKKVAIEVIIRRQEGYWYYGSLDDAVPPHVYRKKKLTITCEGEDLLVTKVGDFID